MRGCSDSCVGVMVICVLVFTVFCIFVLCCTLYYIQLSCGRNNE